MTKIESLPKETLMAFYSSFKNIAPVRVLIKIANKEELPAGLPKNVKTFSWLPQLQVLSTFISECVCIINFMYKKFHKRKQITKVLNYFFCIS